VNLKKILLSLIPCLLAAPSLAATISVSPGQNVAGALAGAHYGDTVVLGSGTFNLNSPITVPSGVTLTGVSYTSTHLVFNIAGADSTSYGILVAGNASNVTIEQLDVHSNHGLIQLSLGDPYTDSYQNIVITRNAFQYGGGQLSDGSLVYGISVTMTNNGLQITHNYFHDSQNSVRNWSVFYPTNANLDYNLFYNIEDGGQIQYPGGNNSFSHNYGTMIHRMCQESASTSKTSINYVGNVFYDWYQPYPDSFGVSIVGSQSGQVNYTNNYFRASIAPGSSWGTPDGSGVNRFGYAFESTGWPCNVTANTFVGYWACEVCSQSTQTNVWNNVVYGGGLWGEYDGQTGGSINAYSNSTYAVTSAPNPPANTFAGPNPSGSPVTSSAPPPTPPTTTGGSLSGSLAGAASSNNLTSLGTSDWAHWGRNGSYGNYDHKASGGSKISNVSQVGSGGFGGYFDSTRNVSWSDGTPTSSDSGDDGYLWANNNTGVGYSFTVPANTSKQTLTVYLGGYSSGSTLTAHLSDGSAADYLVTLSNSGHYNNIVTITYNAASANQKLTVTYVKSQNINGTGGSADLMAAWLSGSGSSPATSSGSTTTSSSGTAPGVWTGPTSVSVSAGSTVTFTASANGGNPAPTVQWQISTNGQGSWSNISGATSLAYSLTAQTSENGDWYRAVFSNSAGSATTLPASLSVH
jgi:hypothetical protein